MIAHPPQPSTKAIHEYAIAIAPMITALSDEVLALRCKYQNGEQIDHAVGEVRNALENLEDAMEKNQQAQAERARFAR